jgi:hypothetical protein
MIKYKNLSIFLPISHNRDPFIWCVGVCFIFNAPSLLYVMIIYKISVLLLILKVTQKYGTRKKHVTWCINMKSFEDWSLYLIDVVVFIDKYNGRFADPRYSLPAYCEPMVKDVNRETKNAPVFLSL